MGLVAHLVWAFVAGSLVALAIAAGVALVVRIARPDARVRALMWFFTALLCVVAPATIAGAMLVRHTDAPRVERRVAWEPPHAASASAPLRRVADASRAALAAPSFTPPIAQTIAILWIAGVIAGMAGLARSIWRVRALKARSSPLDGALAGELPWLTDGAGREIYLRLSYEIETPIAIGFRRPVILVPTEMANDAGLRAIEPLVMHEYAHLAHYDDWTNLAQRVVERIAWCNPLVWIVGRWFALEREVAADEAVVARTHDAPHYASALWQMAREMRMPEHVVVAPGAMLTRKQISVRIERILDETKPRPAFAFIVGIVAFGMAGVAAVAAGAPPLEPHVQVAQATATSTPTVAPSTPTPTPTPRPTRTPGALPTPSTWPAPVVSPVPPTPAPRAMRHIAVAPRPWPAPSIDRAALERVQGRIDEALRHADLAMEHAQAEAMRAAANEECSGCDLARADLRGRDLHGRRFSGTDFSHADLRGADLHDASFFGSDLHGADLRGADLRGARFTGSNLHNADLSNADARRADFTGADLGNATLDGTRTDGAHFTGTTLP
jgi:beta-lactamase regulating signal transducer with metallopeptidase domain